VWIAAPRLDEVEVDPVDAGGGEVGQLGGIAHPVVIVVDPQQQVRVDGVVATDPPVAVVVEDLERQVTVRFVRRLADHWRSSVAAITDTRLRLIGMPPAHSGAG